MYIVSDYFLSVEVQITLLNVLPEMSAYQDSECVVPIVYFVSVVAKHYKVFCINKQNKGGETAPKQNV